MANSVAEAAIDTNYPIFPYNTQTSRSDQDASDNTNEILSFHVKKGDR